MSTTEATSEAGNNNEEKMSDDNDNTTKNTEKELTNQELDQIIQNITMAGSTDQMANLTNDEHNNPGINMPTESPNNGSDSHDEDILLRWDDDEDDQVTDQKKNDDIILKEIQEHSDQIAGSSKAQSGLLSDNSNNITSIKENFVSDEANDTIMDEVISESDKNINSHEMGQVSSTNDVQINVKNNVIKIGGLNSDDKDKKENTSKIDDKSDSLISSSDQIIDISSSKIVIGQICDKNDISTCSTSNINDDTSIDKGKDALTSIIDETKLICSIKDKVDKALREVKHESQENDDSEQEEKSCEANIKFLEQQLKVLAQSINTNISTTDVLDDIPRKEVTNDSPKTIPEITTLTVSASNNGECSVNNEEKKVVIDTESNDQVNKNEHLSECGLIENINFKNEKVTNVEIKTDLKSECCDEVKNETLVGNEIIENVNSISDKEKDKDLSGNKNETIQDNKPSQKDTDLEMDVDEIVDDNQTDKLLTQREIVQSIDSSTDKENTAKDKDVNVSFKSENKKSIPEAQPVEMETNSPKEILKESETNLFDDMDDDVVEIIEKCDNYIDLRSQSPISIDNDPLDDSDKSDVSDTKKSSADNTSGEGDKKVLTTKDSSNYYSVKTDHRLRPDVMLEIPMQNLIDVDDIDETIDIDSEETSQDSVTKATEATNKESEKNTNVVCKEEKISLAEKYIKNVDLLVGDVKNAGNELKDDKSLKTENKSFLELTNIIKIESNETVKEANIKKETCNNDETFINLYDEVILKNEDTEENKEIKLEETSSDILDTSKGVEKDTTQPPSYETRMTPDTADEAPEVSDSLGLLAESSRVRREDEDMEEEDDDDDDYDQYDESSNQMTAEHSEDSNAQQSEPDSKDQEDKTEDKERPFSFVECAIDVHETAVEIAVAETVASEQPVSSVDETSKDVSKESTATETSEEQTKKDDEFTTSTTNKETAKPSDTLVTDTDASRKEKDAAKSTPTKDDKAEGKSTEATTQSPSKTMKLAIAKQRHVLNIVDLEESSSSEEDGLEPKQPIEDASESLKLDDAPSDVTSVNIPTEIEIMSTSGGNTSEIVTKEGEVVIQGVPKPPPHKPARLNTSEVTIKTAHASTESTLVIPETKMTESTATTPKLGLEIFNLDSDDDDIGGSGKEAGGRQKLSALELDAALRSGRCLRRGCGAGARGAAGGALGHYCHQCAHAHLQRTQSLVEGIKNMTPLLDLNMEKLSLDLVEISDSDSDNETEEPKETIGEAGATILEEKLADMINSMWRKYKIDASLKDAKVLLDAEMERLDNESKEINKMLNECQVATDNLRKDLYSTFEPKRQELAAISIYDTSDGMFISNECDPAPEQMNDVRHGKRRLSAGSVQPSKKPAIPLGYAPLEPAPTLRYIDQDTSMLIIGGHSSKYEDDKEVSVVQLSVESAPADLPPPGEPKRPPLKVGMQVYAMRNAFGSWSKARIQEAIKTPVPSNQFPSFRVKFEYKLKNACKVLSARCLAYMDVAEVRLTIGTRVIALFKDAANQKKTEAFYSGIIAEIPNPVNNFRYLVFFDDGYAQYARHAHTRVVCASAAPVWEEVHPFSREFVRNYLCAYPERPMVRLHAGQRLNTEWNGKWWDSRVIQVDASLVQVHFEEDNRTEWIYRGSTRLEPLFLELQAAVRHRGRHLPRSKAQLRTNMPYVEYTRSYEQDRTTDAQQQEELRRQRAVAKKSTVPSPAPAPAPAPPHMPHAPNADLYHSRVVYYTPRNAVRPYKMVPHNCGPKCKRSDVLTLKELRSYNPLAKPLLSGWERQLVRHKGGSAVLYRAPCGRRLRGAAELQRYLRLTHSDAPVDLFDFNPDTHCLAEFVLSKCIVGKKDLSHGKENVPVPCVNSVDDSLPEFCTYNTERTPTAGVPLNLDPEFLCGCDCTDDCEDKSKCACWKMTLEGARTIGLEGTVGYVYKRLPEPLPSGIYECNVRCKCRATCLNRVAQHPLQLKLQVFKTPNRGWGIRALNDVPKGAFLCVYAGNLLTDATANLDGLNEGDEYLAELDYIEVVEQMKEGYEEDVPEADKILDKQETKKEEEKTSSEEESSSEEDEKVSKDEEQDDDFRPGYIGLGVMEFNKRLRKRGKKKGHDEGNKEDPEKKEEKEIKDQNADEDCITISDDEEVREPSRFTAQAGMGANEYVPKYRSVREHFGRDEACYIMDAKVQGNIGRYLNHSCSPNVFVQNVFVDTHDPRFPWVAFFALSHIRAGTELTWNYNYDVGSVPGKVLYCYCGAPNCRRRLL